ncbi:putative cytochrome P450 [Tanacetum coccineum]
MDIFIIFPSWLLTTVPVLISMLCFFHYILRSINQLSMDVVKLPPSPPKLPIIGNLHQLIRKPRHQALWQLSKEYGPIMQIQIGSKPFLVISSSAMAKQILKTQDHVFCSRPKNYASKLMMYNFLDIAFSPQSDLRREKRKIMVSEFLGPKKAKMLNRALAINIEQMVHSLSLNPSNAMVDVNKVVFTIVSGMVFKAGFGIDYKEEPIKGLSFIKMLEESQIVLNGSFVDSFPWLGRIIDHLSGWNDRLEKCFSGLDAYIEMVIQEHYNRTNAEISEHDKDFLHAILELSSKHDASDYRLTIEDVKALIMDVLIGGVDTTAVTIVWAMSEIARNTRIKKKLQNEIRICMGRIQESCELDLTKMTYLKQVVKETLRLHLPAPLLVPHESLSHTHISGYDVFPGTTVLINGWGIGRDPSTWGENAAEFYPERFEEVDVNFGGVNFDFIPFGRGRRSCPAMNTAPAIVESVIANLLYWFDWEVPDIIKNEELNMEEEGSLIVRRKLPLCLVPTKHKWEN